ncbi:GNAT family N-acetyltransferase [Advenella sp. FME57]|uniref:GNAT family N-acetyltransferase n=1 Tax=Advenella sp. FME57 TaxID=2742604 RepID=UPI00351C0E5E
MSALESGCWQPASTALLKVTILYTKLMQPFAIGQKADAFNFSFLFLLMNTSATAFQIRSATTQDVDAMFKIRTSVRENSLTSEELFELGITPEFISAAIKNSSCAWVATVDNEIVGFSMVDLDTACLFAAFVLPEYEGLGIGTDLIKACESELFIYHPVAWLETAQFSRAAKLYRYLGWGNEAQIGEGDVRLEKHRN